MKLKPKFLILLAVLLLIPASSQAGLFDFLKPHQNEQTPECAKQIRIFRKFLYDGRICKQDDDCIVMEGMCPMGCNLYLNKNFEEIITTEKGKLAEACPNTVCYYKCEGTPKLLPKCVRNRCQAKSIK